MLRPLATCAAVFVLGGCASAPPLLTARDDLKANVGQVVRVAGTAHFYNVKAGCPSVQSEEFEVFVYPRNAWGSETLGKRVEVTGRLASTARTVPPDSYINPGEYWLNESAWKLLPEEKK